MSKSTKHSMSTTKRKSGFSGKRKTGAPRNNRNAIRHGLKAGQLPADCKDIEIRLNVIRRNIEDAVLTAKGKVSLADAAYINTAMRWERHAALAHRWLTKQYRLLKIDQQLHFSKEIATASAKRDAALEMLLLDESQSTVFEALYAKATPALEVE